MIENKTNPEDISSPCNSNELQHLKMLATDFDNIYKVNLQALKERLTMLKLTLTFLSAPFIVATALISSKIIQPDVFNSFTTTPTYIFTFILICGLANLIPLFRFIEVSSTHMRTARVINNFRLYYCINMRNHFTRIDWEPNLPVDPDYPQSFGIFNWTGINIIFMVAINSFYISLGIFGMDHHNPFSISGICTFLFCFILQYIVYIFKGKGFVLSNKPKLLQNFKKAEI
jgi:hypothetical protein